MISLQAAGMRISQRQSSGPYLRVVASTPEDEIATKIKSFGNLLDGWDFGVGTHATPEVISRALELQTYYGPALGLKKMNAFPGTDGEISVTFYCGDESVDVTINLDLTYTVTYEKGIGVDYEQIAYKENVNLGTVLDFFRRLSCAKWKSSVDFTPASMIQRRKDSEAMPLRIVKQQHQKQYPSLIKSAFKILPEVIASTWNFSVLPQ